MKVPRFLYSRFDSSPRGKSGFHIAHWSKEAIDENELVNFEEMIYWPQVTEVKEKLSIFPVTISSGSYQAICLYRDQPHLQDKFGRGGIFVAHGFLVPLDKWIEGIDIVRLVEGLKGKALNVDEMELRPDGDLSPIEIETSPLREMPSYELDLSGKSVHDLVIALRKVLSSEEKMLIMIPEASIDKLALLLQQLYFFLPPEDRKKLSVDFLYDEGSLFFTNFKVLGYREQKPKGTPRAEVTLRELTSSGGSGYIVSGEDIFKAIDSYDRWLTTKPRGISEETVTKVYNVSVLLDKGRTLEDGADIVDELPEEFIRVNLRKIEELFPQALSTLKSKFSSRTYSLLHSLLNYSTPVDKLELIIGTRAGKYDKILINILDRVLRRLRTLNLEEATEILNYLKREDICKIINTLKEELTTSLELIRRWCLGEPIFKGLNPTLDDIFPLLLGCYSPFKLKEVKRLEEVLRGLLDMNDSLKLAEVIKGDATLRRVLYNLVASCDDEQLRSQIIGTLSLNKREIGEVERELKRGANPINRMISEVKRLLERIVSS